MSLSLRSDALEPTRAELVGLSAGEKFRRYIPIYGLPIIVVLLIILFSALFPETFPTLANANALIDNKAIIALLSLAALAPMAAGKIDLTIGFGIVLWHILVISLQLQFHIPWQAAVVFVLMLGACLGLVNALLVEFAQIDAFVATLGTGTIVYAIALWYTGGRQVVGQLSEGFYAIDGLHFAGIPVSAFYVLVLSVVLWLVFDYLPLGRFVYAIGANPRAAALNGISVRRYVTLTFVVSGVLTAFAGVVLASQLQIGQASVGLDFLLPALVGVFLGSTTIKPGRVNVWGTLVGVTVLAVGISGIQQLGADFYVEPLFNGVTLIASIGIAGFAQRRRIGGIAKKLSAAALATTAETEILAPVASAQGEPQRAATLPQAELIERAHACVERMSSALSAVNGAETSEAREQAWRAALADEAIGAELRRLTSPSRKSSQRGAQEGGS
jgi:ribose transport system permease protein